MPVSNTLSPVEPRSVTFPALDAEADQLRVAAGARREPLRADVERLEEVRLPGAVRAVKEHDSG